MYCHICTNSTKYIYILLYHRHIIIIIILNKEEIRIFSITFFYIDKNNNTNIFV